MESCVAKALPPEIDCCFTVQSRGVLGKGPVSAPCAFTTPPLRPASAPRGVEVVETGLDTLTLAWKAPSKPNGIIRKYWYVAVQSSWHVPRSRAEDVTADDQSTQVKVTAFFALNPSSLAADSVYYDVLGEESHREAEFPGDKLRGVITYLLPNTIYRLQGEAWAKKSGESVMARAETGRRSQRVCAWSGCCAHFGLTAQCQPFLKTSHGVDQSGRGPHHANPDAPDGAASSREVSRPKAHGTSAPAISS